MNLAQLRYALEHGSKVWEVSHSEGEGPDTHRIVAHFTEEGDLAGTEPVQTRTLIAAWEKGYLTWEDTQL